MHEIYYDIEIIILSCVLFVFKIMEEGAHQFKSVANQAGPGCRDKSSISLITALSCEARPDRHLPSFHSFRRAVVVSRGCWVEPRAALLITQHQIEIKTNDVNINLPLLSNYQIPGLSEVR